MPVVRDWSNIVKSGSSSLIANSTRHKKESLIDDVRFRFVIGLSTLKMDSSRVTGKWLGD